MAQTTGIEWTDATWNPIRGCTRISPGCGGPGPHGGCYAEWIAARFSKPGQAYEGLAEMRGGKPRWTGEISFGHDLDAPLRWRRPRRIFVNSMSDLFHERLSVSEIATVFAICVAAHHLHGHILQKLTKRSGRMRSVLADPKFWEQVNGEAAMHVLDRTDPLNRRSDDARATLREYGPDAPPPGIWLGVSAEDQQRADERRDDLAAVAASGWTTFVSYEPALGPVDWRGWEFLSQLISGGESGRNARPSHPDWYRAAHNFCHANGIAFFHKQNGEWRAVSEGEGDWFDDLYRPKVVARHGESQDALNDVHGRRCMVPQIVMTRDGDVFTDIAAAGAFQQGSGSMLMFRVGKKRAGRCLDGVEHNGMPEARA